MLKSMYLMILSMMSLTTATYLFYKSIFLSFELTIITLFSMNIPMSMLLDWHSCMFLCTVLFISSMIMNFSNSYIPPNEHNQFSNLMLMFVLSMMLLILSDNLVFILLGWDGLGLSSYILVIYYQNSSSSASGSITIFSNRIGDVMILLAISMLMINSNWMLMSNEEFPLMVLILLILAAISKSAQFPFSAWLPAAMAAPTPISALVHSSTLVTAGVYLLIRVTTTPHPTALMMLMLISSLTTIYASMSANWEQDMKKIIALSTLSQIAIMMFAISINMINIAYFHLIVHAMFKSLMFLCAGTMIHTFSYQDMRHMNANKNTNPMTITMLGISNLALMAIPFMSGFFSKDSIIEAMIQMKMMSPLSILMITSIGMTASYSIRMALLMMKFYLKLKPDSMSTPSNSMEIPILMMAPMSICLGALMIWMTAPEQAFFLPMAMKISIMLLLISGIMMGIMLNFLSKLYMKLGKPALTLWFLHTISAFTTIPTYPMMKSFMSTDKMWQEVYGPQSIMSQTSTKSSFYDNMLTTPLFILLLLSLLPMMFFI